MEEGSFSVEASMLMPIVMFVILSVMFFGFYLRDIMLVETSAKAFLLDINKESMSAEVCSTEEQSRKELLSECMWWGRLITFCLSDDCKSISYRLSGNMFFFNIYSSNKVYLESGFNGTEKVRLWRSIVEEAKELVVSGGSVSGS